MGKNQKDLIIYNDNFFDKIKSFFSRVFKTSNEELNTEIDEKSMRINEQRNNKISFETINISIDKNIQEKEKNEIKISLNQIYDKVIKHNLKNTNNQKMDEVSNQIEVLKEYYDFEDNEIIEESNVVEEDYNFNNEIENENIQNLNEEYFNDRNSFIKLYMNYKSGKVKLEELIFEDLYKILLMENNS